MIKQDRNKNVFLTADVDASNLQIGNTVDSLKYGHIWRPEVVWIIEFCAYIVIISFTHFISNFNGIIQ